MACVSLPSIDIDALQRAMAQCPSGVMLIDVRMAMCYQHSHLRGATSISLPSILWRRFLKQASRPGSLDEFLMGEAGQIAARRRSSLVVLYDEATKDATSLNPENPLLVLGQYFRLEGCNAFYLTGGFAAATANKFPCESSEESSLSRAVLDVPPSPFSGFFNLDSDLSFILGFLAVGCEQTAHNMPLLKRAGITHVLNLTDKECHPEVKSTMVWKKITLRDTLSENLLAHLKCALEFIENARAQGGRILVHCFAGISRSVAVAIGYLMWTQRSTLKEAMAIVQSHRKCASPNLNFLGQLLALGTSLHSLLADVASSRSAMLFNACMDAAARLANNNSPISANG